MRKFEATVRTAEGQEWTYTACLPESIQEAVDIYGEEGALFLLTSGLTVKQQGVARELYKKDKTREEVDQAVAAYRPGQKKSSLKEEALEAIMLNSGRIQSDPDLAAKVKQAFTSGNFRQVLELLR